MTLNTEENGTQTSLRPSISGNSRSMRMLVTTHVCYTLICPVCKKHLCSFFTTMICEGETQNAQSKFCQPNLSCSLTGRCPHPLRNRDVITLRSWLPIGKDYIIMNYSVKHAVSNTHTYKVIHLLSWGPAY